MFAGVLGYHLHHYAFFAILIFAFAATFVVHFINKKKAQNEIEVVTQEITATQEESGK